MNKFITLALVLCASVSVAQCGVRSYGSPYNTAAIPAVQQVNLGSLPNSANIEQYLNGASTSSSSAASSSSSSSPADIITSPIGSYAPVASYGAPPAYAPATAPIYASSPAYAAPASYAPASVPAYSRPAPSSLRLTVQPAYATQLYPGQLNYRAYQSPPQFSTVALPIVPAEPVARLYAPQSSYAPAAPVYSPSAPASY